MSEKQFCHLNALIIDDDAFMRSIITKTLQRLNLGRVESVASGEEALTLLEGDDSHFDILLVDLLMPGMDGIELLRHLAEHEYQGGVLLFSGADSKVLKAAVNVARARYLNVLGSLQKPVTVDALTYYLTHYQSYFRSRNTVSGGSLLNTSELRQGLNDGHLTLYYQPQVDMKTEAVVGVEALARWKHPQHGLLGPGAFVPLAEESNLVGDFTTAVIAQAIDQMQKWKQKQLNLQVAINISSSSISILDLPHLLEHYCQHHKVEASRITLEITETQVGQDMVTMLEVLTRIKLKGLGLSIDDFGTGYSSLERLQRIPFDELKIDGSFVHGSNRDQAARAIFDSSAALGKQLGMSIVAEGVENQDDWDYAAKLGCDIAQGFHIAQPMAPEDFEAWLKRREAGKE
ncbi:EAL domain-containing response regulator [Hahella sp. CR1]|uniref:EAL domain-containing response regulator n=1 Tax=unclassified Hahella TaxID=2624107 RepID=UPI002442C0B2|nr:EAL domain-containing response regulator [Hahella sp. CR1]MDG9669102.1 EAL domain-containing response regulator [Hahella sp. CR1]